jgi:hypothetical protein
LGHLRITQENPAGDYGLRFHGLGSDSKTGVPTGNS